MTLKIKESKDVILYKLYLSKVIKMINNYFQLFKSYDSLGKVKSIKLT